MPSQTAQAGGARADHVRMRLRMKVVSALHILLLKLSSYNIDSSF